MNGSGTGRDRLRRKGIAVSVRDRVLGFIRRIVGTQMIVDILRDQRRADDWAPHMSSSGLVSEMQMRLASRSGSGASPLDDAIRGHLLSIIGSRLGASATHDVHEASRQAFNSLIAGAHPDALAVAEVVALDFREAMRDPGLPLDVACRYYDILYGLYWCGAQRFTDMARFDTKAVIPLAEWLRRHYPPVPARRPLPRLGQPLRVGYLCTYAHLERGNAIAPLVRSIVLEHARQPNRDVFMYCVQWSSPDFVAGFEGSGVTVRDLPQGDTYGSLDGIVNAIQSDGIDVLITDTGTAVSTYVFSRRAAPVQMWIDMGYPFWSIGELDWVLLPGKDHQNYFGIRSDRWSKLRLRQHLETVVRPVAEAQVIEARAVVPVGGFVMACFTRLIKVTPEYTRVVRRLLREVRGAHFVLVGGGASHEANLLAFDPEFRGRVTLVKGMIDLNVYARVVDVFLDTFPFVGGLAAREIAACGVPVVSMAAGEWEVWVSEERAPELCARTEDEYCAIVARLARDPEFRDACRERSRELGNRYVDVDDMMGMIEDGIAKAIGSVTERAARTSPVGGE